MKRRGFTLIELVVAVAIVALLAAIAIPSFVDYVQRGKRVGPRTTLEEAAQWQQRFYNESQPRQYSCTLPTNLQNVPPSGTAEYTVAVRIADGSAAGGTCVQSTNPSTYLLVAAPAGRQASDACGSYRIDNLGNRSVVIGGTVHAGDSTARDCWRR